MTGIVLDECSVVLLPYMIVNDATIKVASVIVVNMVTIDAVQLLVQPSAFVSREVSIGRAWIMFGISLSCSECTRLAWVGRVVSAPRAGARGAGSSRFPARAGPSHAPGGFAETAWIRWTTRGGTSEGGSQGCCSTGCAS